MDATNSTNTKTVAELEAELKEAKDREYAEQRRKQAEIDEARRAEARKKEEAEETQRAALMAPHIKEVADALEKAGVRDVSIIKWGIKIGAGDYPDRDLQISVYREEVGGDRFTFRTRYTGRYILTVGDRYKDYPLVRYPTTKSGGFNVKRIVECVTERIESKAAAAKHVREKKQAQRDAVDLAIEVAAELGYKTTDYMCPIKGTYMHSYEQSRGRWRSETFEAPKGRVYFIVGRLTVTPEQAKVLHEALVKIREMEPKKEKA